MRLDSLRRFFWVHPTYIKKWFFKFICEGGGGVFKSSEKKMPNIWVSVKIACLVSRLQTSIFSLSQTMKLSVLLNGHSAVGSESPQIPESLVRWTDRLDVTISVDWDIFNTTPPPEKQRNGNRRFRDGWGTQGWETLTLSLRADILHKHMKEDLFK